MVVSGASKRARCKLGSRTVKGMKAVAQGSGGGGGDSWGGGERTYRGNRVNIRLLAKELLRFLVSDLCRCSKLS